MSIPNIDFEGNNVSNQNETNTQQNETDTNAVTNQEDITNFNGGDADDITGKDNEVKNNTSNNQEDNSSNNSPMGELNVGDSIDVEGTIYTVADNGDLVDKDGKVFKAANEVSDWLKSVEVEDEDNSKGLTISSIQNALGVTITDENGQDVEFTNDTDGAKAYIDAVINLRSNDLQQAAINRLYQDNPLLKQFQDYVQLTGTPRGFGEIPDRTGIQIDKDNEAQQVAIIRMAAQEFGNKSLNDNYIKYLRDSGGLYDEAKLQLAALAEKDINYRKEIETKAQLQRDEEAKALAEYWTNVSNLIDSRVIAGHKIPESFTKEVDGKKIVVTPKDFYDYVSKPIEDENGNRVTGYQKDLNKLTDAEYLNREMLDAWLMFTGGTYKDLVDMAIKEDKVRQLKIKSKEQRSNKSVRIIKHNNAKANIDDILL